MIEKKDIKELFTEYFGNKDNIINKNLSCISKYEEIQIEIFQKGIDDGLIDDRIIVNIIEKEELFKIFEELFSRTPDKEEITCILSTLEKSKRTYQDGFKQGLEIKNILM